MLNQLILRDFIGLNCLHINFIIEKRHGGATIEKLIGAGVQGTFLR